MGKTLSRLIIEISIATGVASVLIGIIIILVHTTSIYKPHFLGLTPDDFLQFGGICFLFSIAFTGRRILKYMELAHRHERNNLH
ncbi:MAG: hypothetical protein WBO57_07100 [Gammaproteobacteria bacterium]